jgi:putative transposase
MNGITLRTALFSFLPVAMTETLASALGVVVRARKRDLVKLVVALVMTPGSDDSGRQADIFSAYLNEADQEVVRSSFYSWFTEEFAQLMAALSRLAVDTVRGSPPLLSGALHGVQDWLLVDSETITLRDELAGVFPATSTPAGLKVHKTYSLGRNNMVDFHITPARDHDGPQLKVDGTWRGNGLIVDLGYAGFKLIADCERFGVALIIRLKADWKPRLLRVFDVGEDGEEMIELEGEPVTAPLLEMSVDEHHGETFDLDVAFGRGTNRVEARLVGVPGKDKYHWCITLLPRADYTPTEVCQLYRARWVIELDNRCDKGAARLDQIRATTESSVLALIHASLIRTVISNHLVQQDLLERPPTRPPLHAFAVGLALSCNAAALVTAMAVDESARWERLASVIRARGHDPNWRSRPSQLDKLRGTTAPPGRPRETRLRNCASEAKPYRRHDARRSL